MTNCHKCNTENPTGARFCENCGNILSKSKPETKQTEYINFCPDCGKPIELNAFFCAHCGASFGEQCPNCQTINQATAKFCEKCAQPLNWICPICNNKNQVGSIFCAACGKDHHISIGKKLLKPQYIAAASLILVIVVFGISNKFWISNSNEDNNNSYQNNSSKSNKTNSNQSQSVETTKSNSQSNHKDYAFLSFNLALEFDQDPELKLKCPDGVSFDKASKSSGSINYYGSSKKGISGWYEFTYSNTDYEDDGFMGLSSKKVRRSYKGKFHLDGEYGTYDIEITNWGFDIDISVNGY
jgi:hypothetical protein